MEEEAKEEPKENEEDQNIEQKSEEDSPEISKEDQIKDLDNSEIPIYLLEKALEMHKNETDT